MIDRRHDALGKATGRARYTQDFYPAHMLHGVVLRSSHAAARTTVDVSPALDMPGVVAALGPTHVSERRFGIIERDEPLLAAGHVRFVGQPLALVAAETRSEAVAAAAAIDVSYEAEAHVLDLQEALAEGAPQVQPGDRNVREPSEFSRGDLDAAFSGAPHVITTRVRTRRVYPGYIEPRAALAEVDSEERLVVTMCSQAPFQVRQALCEVFGLPMTHVVVRVPAFGGGFGGKLHNGMAPYAAALALETGRPIQVVASREEDMQASNPRENSIVELTSAVDERGRIIGRRATAHFDSGAYTYDTPYITSMGAMQAGGPYAIAAIEARVHAVRTNTQPTGSVRAPSAPQMCFANEVHMEEIAEQLDLDPVELRRRNLMKVGDLGPTGQEIQNPAAADCLERGKTLLETWRDAAADQPLPDPLKRGFGLAMAWWFTAPGPSAASVRVEEDGTVTVACGATEIGTGAVASGLPALVAAELGIDTDQVRLVSASTDSAPQDFGSEGSRTLYGAGNAALRAAGEVRAILAEHAAEELEANPEDIIFADGSVHVAGSPQSALSLAEVRNKATLASGSVVGTGRFQPPPTEYIEGCATGMLIPMFNEPTFHCHVAEIEFDPELGGIKVRRYAAIHDTGPIVSWAGVKGQIEGGVVQGLGYALFEEMQTDENGVVSNADLVDYRIPTVADIPAELLVVPIVDHPSNVGPSGAKGIGEAPVIPVAAVIASAVRDATGMKVMETPLTADRICARPGEAVGA